MDAFLERKCKHYNCMNKQYRRTMFTDKDKNIKPNTWGCKQISCPNKLLQEERYKC